MARKTTPKTVTSKPAAAPAAPNAAAPAALKAAAKPAAVAPPSYEQIAARAYENYRERSRLGKPGNADSDWLAAEAELRKPRA